MATETEIRGLEQLVATIATRLRQCETVDELCVMVGEVVHQMLPRDLIVVTLYDPSLDAITIRSHHGLGVSLERLFAVMGVDPRQMAFRREEMTAEERRRFCSGRLEPVPDGVYELVTRKLPRAMCVATERVLRIRGLFTIGFALDDEPYGGLILARRDAGAPKEAPLLELLSAMVSLAIRQREVEQAKAALERQLQRAQKIEAIGKLAGGVAHDFNNALQTICMLTELMREGLPAGHPHQEYLGDLLSSVDRARGLTRSLLAVGRRQVLRLDPLELDGFVLDIERMLRRTLRDDIVVVCHSPPTPVMIQGDRAELVRALLNLAINAQDAMAEGGTLRIEVAAEGGSARLRVCDTGCGMSPEDAQRAFEPFFTTKSADHGSGLGLAAVQGIVAQHQGEMTLESVSGEGTTVDLRFPLLAEADEAPAERRSSPPRGVSTGAGQVVLLVDDEPVVRRPIRLFLESRGWKVLEAFNGVEALRLLEDRTTPPRLVVSDVVMPDMGGLQLLDRLYARFPGIPAILTSGYSDRLVEGNSLPPEVRFLPKPFSPKTLTEMIDEMLAGEAVSTKGDRGGDGR